MLDKKDLGVKYFFNNVFNKMKPQFLYIQQAGYVLVEDFWIIWIDSHMMKEFNLSNVEVMNRGGFNLYGFTDW